MSQRTKRRRAFARHAPHLTPVLRRMARALAPHDPDLADDLLQEGLIAMYQSEPDAGADLERDGMAACIAVRAMCRYRARAGRVMSSGGNGHGWSIGTGPEGEP